jgi:hypothetical protein
MSSDEKLAMLDRRLRHLPFFPNRADRSLLDMMWDKLDHALAHQRLDVREVSAPSGMIREITALGIIRYYVDPQAFRISGMAMKADGLFHPIGDCLHAVRLFWVRSCAHWWLRFAFQTWAPRCSGIDMIDEPANRPCNIELDTSQLIVRRLCFDRRFMTLVEDFDDALGLPPLARMLIEEQAEASYCDVDRASEIWQQTESVAAAIRQVIHRTQESDRR